MKVKSHILIHYLLATIAIDSRGYTYCPLNGNKLIIFNSKNDVEFKATNDFLTMRDKIQSELNCDAKTAEKVIDKRIYEMLAD